MKPLTNMENRWVHSTKEAFDALVAMGYAPYTDKYLGYEKLEVANNGIIFQGSVVDSTSKQAYYHNGHFYDQPYEEFTITEEKVPFPELEDIEWVRVEAPEWYGKNVPWIFSIDANVRYQFNELHEDDFGVFKTLHENSKDFKVTWKLKEKINRKLHENRPLALAIGRWLDEEDETIKIQDERYLVMISTTCTKFITNKDGWGKRTYNECTIPDNYIIPDQVLQWMKEYQEAERED